MVQEQIELNRPLGLAEPHPVKQTGAKLYDRGIQAEELVFEAKPALSKVQLPALPQKLLKQLLVQFPRPGAH